MLNQLQHIIQDRIAHPKAGSYTNELLDAGAERIAQKVGEEGVEVVIAALTQGDEAFLNEMADLIYHATVLLAQRNLTWEQVEAILSARHQP